MSLCPKCENEPTTNDGYCDHCGCELDDASRCESHPEAPSTARCLVCKRPLCDACRIEANDKAFCVLHSEYQTVENWAVVYSTNQEWEAQLLKAALGEKEIPCVVDSKKDSARSLTVGLMSEINIMVPIDRILQTETFLDGWESAR